jgi:glucarate dehydratase
VRIVGASLHTIDLPLTAPTLWAGGLNHAWTRTVVRVQTDDGLEGLAETDGSDSTRIWLTTLREAFLDTDPFAWRGTLRGFAHVGGPSGLAWRHASQAFETACWDLMAKAAGLPLHSLLGGRMRRRIPAIAYVMYQPGSRRTAQVRTPDEVVDHTGALVDRFGFGTIKLKGGVHPPSEEHAATKALRTAFPEHQLRFDPNALWSVETSLRLGRGFEELDLEWYEDPCAGIEGMSRARSGVRIPFATNMCCTQLGELPTAIRASAFDVQLLDVDDWGGLTNVMKAAATCDTFQLGVGIHSSGESGIGTALNLHLAASLNSLPHAMDSFYHLQALDVITEPFSITAGSFQVPDGPGLGVTLDEDQLKFLEEQHDRNTHRTKEVKRDHAGTHNVSGRW